MDKISLDAQLIEQNTMQSADDSRNDAYAREMIKNDKLGVLYQERQDRDARDLQKVYLHLLSIYILIQML